MVEGQQGQNEGQNVIATNERSLRSLGRAISLSSGQFSLVVACCNYEVLQQRMLQTLQENALRGYNLKKVELPHNARSLYRTIHLELTDKPPQALMVLGLETVEALDDLLRAINHIRDEFRKHHPFPLVLWVTDEVLRKLRRFAPDFASWAATPIRFEMTADELLLFLRQETDSWFARMLQVGTISKQTQARVTYPHSTLEKVQEDFSEMRCAIGELLGQGIEIERSLQASLEFVFGLDEYIADNISDALNDFHESLKFWQSLAQNKTSDEQNWQISHSLGSGSEVLDSHTCPLLRSGVLLYYIGLSYCRLADRNPTQSRHYWQEAKIYLQQCIDTFEKAKRPDLVAQFISQLAEVLQHLHHWKPLQRLAQKSLELHQNHGNHLQLACDYGYLAEAAIHCQQWAQVCQYARVGLWKLYEAQEHNEVHHGIFPLMLAQIYRLFLAKALRCLGDAKIAREHLKTASQELTKDLESSDHRYDAYRYLRHLQKLQKLYFAEGRYLEAFSIKQKQRSVEQQYGFSAFIGAGRLQPQQQATAPALVSPFLGGSVALEITASGRQRDIKNLITRISRTDQKLTVIHGFSGVGKSSTVTAGLVPALQKLPIGDQIAVPVVVQIYTDWARELGKSLTKAINQSKGIEEASALADGETLPEPVIPINTVELLEKLRENAKNHYITVLIFDQFEEFFLNCTGNTNREKQQEFDRFLCDALNIPFVKVIFSLREDYLHRLLEFKQLGDLETIQNNILDQSIRYQLNNFSTQDAKTVIEKLTERSHLNLEPELIDALVTDLSAELGEVRPIELQVVGAQLQYEGINTLEKYQPYRPNKLIERYIRQLIKDCGEQNERAALLVLYLLTDENNKRPFKTRAELTAELAELESIEKLELVLEILVRSGLVVLFPDVPERYQLIHDYLVGLIRYMQQAEGSLQAQLKQLRRQVEKSETEIARLNSELRQKKQKILPDIQPQSNLDLVTELKELRKREELSRLAIDRMGAELEQQKLQAELRSSEARLNRVLKKALTISVVASLVLTGFIVFSAYQTRQSLINEIKATSSSSEALFALDKDIDALKEALKAGRKQQNAFLPDAEAQERVQTALYQSTFGMKELNRLEGHASEVNSVTFSPDGKTIASAGVDNIIKLWSASGRFLQNLEGHKKQVNSISYSPDGQKLVSASSDKTLKIWGRDGKLLTTLPGHGGVVYNAAFSPKGEMIASASADKTIKLWSRDGKLLKTLTGHQDLVRAIAWSPDGNTIASASNDQTVKLWSREGELLTTLSGHDSTVLGVDWSKDGQNIVSSCWDGSIKLWNKNGKLIRTLWGHKEPVTSVVFSPDGSTIASTSSDHTIKIGTMDGKLLETFKGHGGWVNSASFSPDKKTIASASRDRLIKIWSLQNSSLTKLNRHTKAVTSVNFSAKGDLIASASEDGMVNIWNSRQKKLISSFKADKDTVWDVRFSPDGQQLATAGKDTKVKIWNLKGNLINTLSGHENVVLSVAWSPDGKTLASASRDETVKLWSSEGKLLKNLYQHKETVNWVSWSPDGKMLASASDDKTVILWRPDGSLITPLIAHSRPVFGVAWSSDSKTIASASLDSTVRIWDTNGKQLTSLYGDGEEFNSVSFNPNGKTLAATSDNQVRLWSINGTPLITLKGYREGSREGITNASFNHDGNILAFGGARGAVIMQDLEKLDLDKLLNRGCQLLHDYLETNSKVTDSDRALCESK